MNIMVEIQGDTKLIKEDYNDNVQLEFMNRQSDFWYADELISIDIDKEKAIEIVAFLMGVFKLC